MYAQKPSSASALPIRKISPNSIANTPQTLPCTKENWQQLVHIVMKLVHDKQIKDSVVSDIATRITKIETALDNAPTSDTFTFKSLPPFLRGRLRKSFALISKPLHARSTRRSSYRLAFHQYLGVPGLGIGVSRGKSEHERSQSEEILFLHPAALEVLVKSIAGEKERKLPDLLLKYLQLEKREFVRDWMRGYINLERDDEEYVFSVDSERCDEKDIWIEYIGMFDGMGMVVGENKFGYSTTKCGDKVLNVPISRMDVVI